MFENFGQVEMPASKHPTCYLSLNRFVGFCEPTIWSCFMVFATSYSVSILLMMIPTQKKLHIQNTFQTIFYQTLKVAFSRLRTCYYIPTYLLFLILPTNVVPIFPIPKCCQNSQKFVIGVFLGGFLWYVFQFSQNPPSPHPARGGETSPHPSFPIFRILKNCCEISHVW